MGAQRRGAQTQKKWGTKGHVRTGGVDDQGGKTTGNASAEEVWTTLKEREPEERAGGCSVLVTRLSAVLLDVTLCDVSGWSIFFAMTAASALSRSDCVTENRGCTVELAKLGNTLLNHLLATMLLNHVQHEVVI